MNNKQHTFNALVLLILVGSLIFANHNFITVDASRVEPFPLSLIGKKHDEESIGYIVPSGDDHKVYIVPSGDDHKI